VFDDAPRIYKNVVYDVTNRVKVIGSVEERLQKTLWKGKLDRQYESVNYNGNNGNLEDVSLVSIGGEFVPMSRY